MANNSDDFIDIDVDFDGTESSGGEHESGSTPGGNVVEQIGAVLSNVDIGQIQQQMSRVIEVAGPVTEKVGARNLVMGIGLALIVGSAFLPDKK